MRGLEAVTVGTKDAQILEAVVVSVTVDVIELDGNPTVRRAFRPAAKLALRLLHSGSEELQFELMA